MRTTALQACRSGIQSLSRPPTTSSLLRLPSCRQASSSTTPPPRPNPYARKSIPKPTTTSKAPPPNPSPSPSPAAAAADELFIPEAPHTHDIDPSFNPPIHNPSASPPSASFTTAISSPGSPFPPSDNGIDWSSSFHGLSTIAFSPETSAILMAPLDPIDVEMKPDGIIYLPEIKYRRILNRAFGPGAWGLAPRGELVVGEKVVTREYALVVHGRFVAQARGECQYFGEDNIPTAGEGCKSNALMRCCKDLGIASELWDPRFIREFKKKHCQEIWVEHVATGKKRKVWTRKDGEPMYPYKVSKGGVSSSSASSGRGDLGPVI
ncbi:putative mitochondrial genome maintenance protein [Triangularia setosa]|uniref:Mitochondrial genome maintenance protein MGM101 n=1 Tax=Triangularia setosa TaxID=2587417 RepID=A0AAN6W164_9PEZI|nr:putative mitochondrial genome maintenance protein [Podospora setosa]